MRGLLRRFTLYNVNGVIDMIEQTSLKAAKAYFKQAWGFDRYGGNYQWSCHEGGETYYDNYDLLINGVRYKQTRWR
jgi:hypothetical protein